MSQKHFISIRERFPDEEKIDLEEIAEMVPALNNMIDMFKEDATARGVEIPTLVIDDEGKDEEEKLEETPIVDISGMEGSIKKIVEDQRDMDDEGLQSIVQNGIMNLSAEAREKFIKAQAEIGKMLGETEESGSTPKSGKKAPRKVKSEKKTSE